jgi:hypothetical protein
MQRIPIIKDNRLKRYIISSIISQFCHFEEERTFEGREGGVVVLISTEIFEGKRGGGITIHPSMLLEPKERSVLGS